MSRAEGLVGDRPDTPTTTYRLLPIERILPVVAALLALTAVAWLLTLRQAESMSMMVNGLGQVGRRMPNNMGIVAFLGMWGVMMAAMMSPAVAPVVLAHRFVLGRRDENVASNAAFVVGFLAVWLLVGVAYFLPFVFFRDLNGSAADAWWFPVLSGAILMLAGGYQFTRRKKHCQQSCCTPVALMTEQDAGRGVLSAFRTGAAHGLHCLGCCWALMTVLLVVGLMNVLWMIGVSLIFIVEKHWPPGLRLGRLLGVGLIVLGLAVMIQPSLLHAISGPSSQAEQMNNMKM